ncbi:MAG: ABC transporter permease [Euzebyaceae bacterium]|jgi:spermidine/putrescine transport system permease protein|nr:ABC transporter permease [Euzebyaceae bacterium]
MSGTGARRWLPYLLLLPGGLWLFVFFVVPMLTLASTSLQEGSLQSGYVLTWRIANYTEAVTAFREQFLRSFGYAGIATLLALVIGYPLAYVIAFRAGRWRNVLLLLVIAPFFTSFLIRTLAWKIILSDTGWVVGALKTVGVLPDNGRLLATSAAVVAGITYNFLPFMILPLYASLERIDPRYVEAAQDLYANAFTAFWRVTWPLSLPGVVAGTLLTFIPAAGDFVNVRFLGTPSQSMIGTVIDSRFLVVLDYPTAAALSFLLMLAILVLVVAYVRRAGTEELV